MFDIYWNSLGHNRILWTTHVLQLLGKIQILVLLISMTLKSDFHYILCNDNDRGEACFLFWYICRYSITDQGYILAQKLERVNGDRLSMVSSHFTASITSKLASSALVDTKSGNKLSASIRSVVSTSKPNVECKQIDLCAASARGLEGFTSIVEKKELNPKRYVNSARLTLEP